MIQNVLVNRPLVGYRWWMLTEDGPYSMRGDYTWSVGVSKARCNVEKDHVAPVYNCECGLYGRTALSYLGMALDDDRVVAGIVAGWGGSIVTKMHWRSEYAKIQLLAEHLPERRQLLTRVAKRYSVPVVDYKAFPEYILPTYK